MLPQPPASVDAPPASKATKVSRWKWNWLVATGLVSAVGVLVIFSAPLFMRKRISCGPTEEVNNIRQIGLALFEFEQEYGSLPDASTANRVREQTGSTLSMGAVSSNDYFRQLLATGTASNEAMFFAFARKGHPKPDNVFTPGEALKKGECAFTYLVGTLASDNPGRPVVVAPMVPGTDRFNPKINKGKAVIFKRDNSAMNVPINKNGHVIIGGMNLMDPAHPIWEGKPPIFAWPE